jgi:hypothetical protein
MRWHTRGLIAIAAAIAVMGTGEIYAQPGGPGERFTAIAVGIGPTGRVKWTRLEMTVMQWCTDDDVEALIGTLVADGADALLDQLQETCPVGYLRMPDGMRYDLLFAQRVTGEDGGHKVILLAEVVISAVEAEAIQSGFALIELRLDRNGEGDGEMSIATLAPHGEDAFIAPDVYTLRSIRLRAVRGFRLPSS